MVTAVPAGLLFHVVPFVSPWFEQRSRLAGWLESAIRSRPVIYRHLARTDLLCEAAAVPPRELIPTKLIQIRPADVVRVGPVRLLDHEDAGLSEAGREQVQLLASRLAATGELDRANRVYCASSVRARQTAAPIAESCGQLPLTASCGLCEPHAGEANGLTVDEWMSGDAQTRLQNWSPYAPKGAGGESYTVGLERAARTLTEAVLENEGRTVVVVCHTVVFRAAFWMFLGLPFHATYLDLDIAHTGITEWMVNGWLPGSGQMAARLVRHNDHGHLCEL